jgi:hypothetical protein
MAIDFSGKSWANKTIPNYTDAELLDAMDVYERAGLDGNRDVAQGLTREWERRHGLDHLGN